MKRDFLAIPDFTREELIETIYLAKELKMLTKFGKCPKPLEGKSVGLIFHKASLRTRISFEVGVAQLGGNAIYITDNEIKLGQRETIHDAAIVLSRYLGMIMIRTFNHNDVVELAKYATVPVINGLTDLLHPCQVVCDLLTVLEHKGRLENLKIAYIGDGNNMTNSWLNASKLLKLDLRIGTASSCEPDKNILKEAKKAGMSRITLTNDPKEAVKDADVIYTDVWASMGQKDQIEKKERLLKAFQLNAKLLKYANENAIVMHCLPAERGREITDEVMDGKQSVVFDEAENRLHGQKAIMMKLLNVI
ncbi:MAG: ornithine carbamoyltransferase [Candidatus Coatesbacteria bacterium]|nr:ornithine carbamoyltransferase [Candidatus Coatesbacteria bacterium]